MDDADELLVPADPEARNPCPHLQMAAPQVARAWAALWESDPQGFVNELLAALQATGVLIMDDRKDAAFHPAHPRICINAARSPGSAVAVTTTGTGRGEVTGDPAGIDCGETCTSDFEDNTEVVLTAAPAGDSVFGGWQGRGCSGTASCTVTVDGLVAVSARFDAPPVDNDDLASATDITSLPDRRTQTTDGAGGDPDEPVLPATTRRARRVRRCGTGTPPAATSVTPHPGPAPP